MNRQKVRLCFPVGVVFLQQLLEIQQPISKFIDIILHCLNQREVAMCLRHKVDVWEIGDLVLGFGAQLIDLLHFGFDQLDGALPIRNGRHPGLRDIELLLEAKTQLRVNGGLFPGEFRFQGGYLVEIIGLAEKLSELYCDCSSIIHDPDSDGTSIAAGVEECKPINLISSNLTRPGTE